MGILERWAQRNQVETEWENDIERGRVDDDMKTPSGKKILQWGIGGFAVSAFIYSIASYEVATVLVLLCAGALFAFALFRTRQLRRRYVRDREGRPTATPSPGYRADGPHRPS